MFEGEDIAFNGLEVCSYRYLQGMAKKMNLPSNVKKVDLIEMIRAKKYCTETDLQTIINRVKLERKANAQAKKKKPKRKPFGLQGAEISSTSNSQSPPIAITPKQSSNFIIQYSPDISQTMLKYQPKPNATSMLQPLKTHIESDRVLRSFNSAKRPNYRIMEQNDCMLGVVSTQNSMQEIQKVRQERAYQSVNVTIQKQRPIVTATVVMNPDRQLVPVSRSCNITQRPKRQRKLSGIYPLQPQEKPTYEYVPTVGFRLTDGRVAKINAVIQKPLASTLLPKNRAIKISKKSLIPRSQSLIANQSLVLKNQALIPKRRTLTVQDMINYKVDHRSIDISKNITDTSSHYHEDNQAQEIDRQIYNDQWIDDRASEGNYVDSETFTNVSKTELYPTKTRNIPLNPTRKVYRGCQRDKTATNWKYSIDYQDETVKNDWNISDINEQSLNKQNVRNCQVKDTSESISANYKATQSGTTYPILTDYQIEYQRFNQEIIERNTEYASSTVKEQRFDLTDRMAHARSDKIQSPNPMTTERNLDYTKSVAHDPQIVETPKRNVNYDRSNTNENGCVSIDLTDVNHSMSSIKDLRYQEIRTNQSAITMAEKNHDISIHKKRMIETNNRMDTNDMTEWNHDRSVNTTEMNRSDQNRMNISKFQRNTSVLTEKNDRSMNTPDMSRSDQHRINISNAPDQRVIDMTDRNDRSVQTDMNRSDQHRINTRHQREVINMTNRHDRSDHTQDLSSQYAKMAALTDVLPNNDYSSTEKESNSVYYHKKIRAEQVKKVRAQLPRINDVFSQFNDVQYNNLMQPLYVHVGDESDRVTPKLPVNHLNSTCMLETLYNFKNQFLTNPPVLLIATTTQTYCTYSTNTISTAVAQPAVAEFCNNSNPYKRVSPYQPDYTSRMNEYLKPQFRPTPDVGCDEVLNSSTASMETSNSQELGANVSIPEMVEDALELISQDGDYMERIGMDVRVQCILCDWAGPKIILEYHIKKDHPNEIQHESSDEWSVLLTLGALSSRCTWLSQLVQRGEALYVLSSKYTSKDTVLLALSMIPTETDIEPKRCSITVYNKISGQPYSFESDIKDIPDSMPYEYGPDCLSLDVSKLDLIPNRANLRLVNRELVGSPGKVVVGQTELNNVEIVVYVKLMD